LGTNLTFFMLQIALRARDRGASGSFPAAAVAALRLQMLHSHGPRHGQQSIEATLPAQDPNTSPVHLSPAYRARVTYGLAGRIVAGIAAQREISGEIARAVEGIEDVIDGRVRGLSEAEFRDALK